MKEKYYKISFSNLVFIIIIMLLIIVIAYMYISNNTNTNTNSVKIESETTSENNTIITNDYTEENTSTTILDLNEELSISLSSKVDFTSYTLENLTNVKSFDLNNLDNNLALEMAWSLLDNSYSLSSSSSTTDASTKYCATNEELETVLFNLFGTDFSYTKSSFDAIDNQEFSGYANYTEDVTYSSLLDNYCVTAVDGGGANLPFIFQEFYKLELTDNIAKLYVKIGFANPLEEDENGEINDIYPAIYKSYINSEFTDFIYRADTFDFNYDDVNILNPLTPNSDYSYAFEYLDTYIYTFEYDTTKDDYFLTSFNIDV